MTTFIGSPITSSGLTLISAQTPAAVNTITFNTGLSTSYKGYAILLTLTHSEAHTCRLRFNADSANNYNMWGPLTGAPLTLPVTTAQSGVIIATTGGVDSSQFWITIPAAPVGGNYPISLSGSPINVSTAGTKWSLGGVWLSAAALTSINVSCSSGDFTGKITLYGFN